MLGKLCPACLDKYVQHPVWISGHRPPLSHYLQIKPATRTTGCHFRDCILQCYGT